VDLRYSHAEQAFRSSLRAWLEATLPGLPDKPSPDDWPGRRAYDTHCSTPATPGWTGPPKAAAAEPHPSRS
jgi:hypothetical protein